MNEIITASCEKMHHLADGSVSLVVTSPPYWNAIDYQQHIDDAAAWYRTRNGQSYQEYLDWMACCFAEVLRTLKPGGLCAVIIGTVLLDGQHYAVPHHLIGRLEQVGYEFWEEIIWHKVTGGVKRAGVVIQKPYPGYFYPNIMTEHILVFHKPGPAIYKDRADTARQDAKVPIDDVFVKEMANNVWHIAPVPPGYLPHPCPFPEDIPYRLILLYSYKDELVLDPFAGLGTTCKVARALGRQYAGYETQEEYAAFARRRVLEDLHLRDPLIAEWSKRARRFPEPA